MRMNEGIDWLI